MKNKGLVITTVVFFLIVNTNYYWKGKLGLLAIPTFLLLVFVYIGLIIALIRQIYFAFKEKWGNKRRHLIIGLLFCVLTLTFFRPFGFINFDRLEGENILIAEREGGGNCMTTIKLKDDFTFREINVCFGVTVITGKYYLQNDTIYFDNVNFGRLENEFYKFAVIKPSKFYTDGKHYDLVKYKNMTDTIGQKLWITKNELKELKDKKPNR